MQGSDSRESRARRPSRPPESPLRRTGRIRYGCLTTSPPRFRRDGDEEAPFSCFILGGQRRSRETFPLPGSVLARLPWRAGPDGILPAPRSRGAGTRPFPSEGALETRDGMNLLALVGTGLLALAQSGDVREKARQILRDPDYQVELPGEVQHTGGPRSGTPSEEGSNDRPSYSSSLAKALSWGAVIVCIALLAAWLAQLLGGHRGNAELPATGSPAPSPESVGARILADAEALAAHGRHAEAIHVLLLCVFEALSRGGMNLPASATSREILAGLELEPAQVNALARLVERVEHSLFG